MGKLKLCSFRLKMINRSQLEEIETTNLIKYLSRIRSSLKFMISAQKIQQIVVSRDIMLLFWHTDRLEVYIEKYRFFLGGKTFTMGTSAWSSLFINKNTSKSTDQQAKICQSHISTEAGIIPRVINEIFLQKQAIRNDAELTIRVSFVQIYNQQIIDLLADKQASSESIGIREQNNQIKITGVQQQDVKEPSDMISLLQKGGRNRATKKTSMNSESSRSHAIFTIFMKKQLKSEGGSKQKGEQFGSNSTIYSKFFLVDLAGSERAKKTGATGKLFKQGVNINLGLLQLGNVISALSTVDKKQDQYITYRNSKLTRILKNCLGGNSNTYMIACVSPAESNYEQSLNSLKYASKAMNIKNKPVINRDPFTELKMKVVELESQNFMLKKLLSDKGVKYEDVIQNQREDQREKQVNGLKNAWDHKSAKKNIQQNKKLERHIQELKQQLLQESQKRSNLQIKNFDLVREKDYSRMLLQDIKKSYPNVFSQMKIQMFHQNLDNNDSKSNDQVFGESASEKSSKQSAKKQKIRVIDQYLEQIQNLNAKLQDKQKFTKQLEQQLQKYVQMSKKDEKYCIQQTKEIRKISMQNMLLKKQMGKLSTRVNELKQDLDRYQQSTTRKRFEKKDVSTVMKSQGQGNLSGSIQFSREESFEVDPQFDPQNHPEFMQLQKKQQILQGQFSNLNNELQEKQDYLQRMNAEQISLEYQLLTQMKQQYHHKISQLQKQKQELVKYTSNPHQEKLTLGLGSKDKVKYVSRIQNLQGELKQYRRKIKQQKNLEKLVSSQTAKIKQLAQQIKKAKLQKMDLSRKIKLDKEDYQKFKTSKLKDLLISRKQGIKKDRQIKKLEMQNAKSTHVGVKKEQELKRMRKINQSLKAMLTKGPNVSPQINSSIAVSSQLQSQSKPQALVGLTSVQSYHQLPTKILHHRQKEKQQNPKDTQNVNKSYQHAVSSKNVVPQPLRQFTEAISDKDADILINDVIKRILLTIVKAYEIQKYEKKVFEGQKQLEELFNEQAITKLKIERLKTLNNLREFKQEEERQSQASQENEVEMQQLSIKINDLYQRVQNSQDNLQYNRQKIQILMQQETGTLFDMDSQILCNKKYSSVQSLKKVIRSTFIYLHSCLESNYKSQEELQQKYGTITERDQQIQMLKQQISTLNWEHRQALKSFRQEMLAKYYRQQNQQNQNDFQQKTTVGQRKLQMKLKNARNMDQKERILYQSKITQLSKLRKEQSSQIQKLNKKVRILQQKYEKATRQMLNFDKIRKNSEVLVKKDQKQVQQLTKKNQKMMGDINEIISEFDHLKSSEIKQKQMRRRSSGISKSFVKSVENEQKRGQGKTLRTSKQYIERQNEVQAQKTKYNLKWKCLSSIDSHGSAISCLASYTNILISGGSKNLKIWDLQTNKMISDLSGLGNIRDLFISQQKRIILAACDKNILIWDLTTLQSQASLKAHKQDVKCLHVNGDLLFSGSKGTLNSNSLMFWDFRKLGIPVAEKERNQDIQFIKSYKNHVFYASNNKKGDSNQLRKLNTENLQTSAPFQNCHKDLITGVTGMKVKSSEQLLLVSSSKDQLMKVWSMEKGINNLVSQREFGNKENYTTTLHGNFNSSLLYSGFKDGSIRLSTCEYSQNESLVLQSAGAFKGHSQSVTTICSIEESKNVPIFASGSNDKIVKLWKLDQESLSSLQQVQLSS